MESQGPSEWVRIRKKVSPKYEATAILFKLEGEGKYPAVFFQNLEGYSIPAVTNLHATRKRLALALGVGETEVVEEYKKRENERIPPKLVKEGPIKEVIQVGEEVNLHDLPLFMTQPQVNTIVFLCAYVKRASCEIVHYSKHTVTEKPTS